MASASRRSVWASLRLLRVGLGNHQHVGSPHALHHRPLARPPGPLARGPQVLGLDDVGIELGERAAQVPAAPQLADAGALGQPPPEHVVDMHPLHRFGEDGVDVHLVATFGQAPRPALGVEAATAPEDGHAKLVGHRRTIPLRLRCAASRRAQIASSDVNRPRSRARLRNRRCRLRRRARDDRRRPAADAAAAARPRRVRPAAVDRAAGYSGGVVDVSHRRAAGPPRHLQLLDQPAARAAFGWRAPRPAGARRSGGRWTPPGAGPRS